MKTILILLTSSFAFLAMAEPHIWTLQNGNKFSGDYYSAGQEKVVVTIKISELSEADKKYITEQKAAQLQAAKQQASKIKPVRINSIPDRFGHCEVTGLEPIPTQIIMLDIPGSVKDYLADYYQLLDNSTVGNFKEEKMIMSKSRSASEFDLATTSLTAGSSDNTATTVQKTYNTRLTEVKAHLAENTTVLAYPLGYLHDGLPVWQCVGVVSK